MNKIITVLSVFLLSKILFASEVTVCIVADNVKNNSKYYHVATTESYLTCELAGKQGKQTLKTLYAKGWNLIEVINIDNRFTTNKKTVPSPIYYLER